MEKEEKVRAKKPAQTIKDRRMDAITRDFHTSVSGTKERGKKKQKLRNKERKYVKSFERVRELTVYSDRVTSESEEEESELKTLILEETKRII